MRLATLTLAMLGFLITSPALAVERPTTIAPVPQMTVTNSAANVTPARCYVYRPVPRWYGPYRYRRYYTYRPRYDWYGPRYYQYYADPYPGYYYPNGFGFAYYGPWTSFRFGF
jgi:hypothetical protein